MGWCSALALCQYLLRRMLRSPPPAGVGLPPQEEVRKDTPMPGGSDCRLVKFWEAFIHSFDAGEVVLEAEAKCLQGKPSCWDHTVDQAFNHWSMLSEPSKELHRWYEARTLGAHIDG